MNVRQKTALWIGIAVMGIMILFPPQIIFPQQLGLVDMLKSQFGGSGSPAPLLPYTRYSFLFAPPHGSVGIDWERCLLPLIFVVFATLGAVYSLQTKHIKPQAPTPAAPSESVP